MLHSWWYINNIMCGQVSNHCKLKTTIIQEPSIYFAVTVIAQGNLHKPMASFRATVTLESDLSSARSTAVGGNCFDERL